MLWYLSDQQNSVRDVAKYASTTAGSQASVRNHVEYDGFGNVTSVDDPSIGTESQRSGAMSVHLLLFSDLGSAANDLETKDLAGGRA